MQIPAERKAVKKPAKNNIIMIRRGFIISCAFCRLNFTDMFFYGPKLLELRKDNYKFYPALLRISGIHSYLSLALYPASSAFNDALSIF
jgi:hypothetical protein